MTALGAAIPFYRRLASPLHAARASVSAAWAFALFAATLLCDSPILLAALLFSVLAAAAGARVAEPLLRVLRSALIVALPIVLVNVLVSRDGLTVFARLGDLGPFGRGDLTLEALAYGGLIALKVALIILTASLASLAVDPDELLRALRRLSFRSALTASIATRMLPLLAADARRLAEAQRTRADASVSGPRVRLALIGAVVGGSLDRAMDVAATLEVRGFAAARSRPAARRPRGPLRVLRRGPAAPSARRVRRPFSRHDIAFALSAASVLAIALVTRLTGAARFDSYPTLDMPLHAATFALALALAAATLLPFADRRGIDP
jgi:energy-coupling factor transport system permease protein